LKISLERNHSEETLCVFELGSELILGTKLGEKHGK